MNLDHLSDQELLSYLHTVGTTDPIVSRLIRMTETSRMFKVIDELISDAKMDKDSYDFFADGTYLTPAEYICKLENDIDWLTREVDDAVANAEMAKLEAANLKARPVSQLIAELKAEIEKADAREYHAKDQVKTAIKEKDEALHKLNMWAVLNR